MAMKIEPAKLAVMGSPIGHSKSPVIHAAAYEALGLPWEYAAHECEADQLEAYLESRPQEWRGFSLTMPLKEEAFRLARVRDAVAEESGVVNTLLRVIDGPEGPQWAGFNTDVAGLAAALSRNGLDASHTVVIGAGATAVSAVLAARSIGAQYVTVVARRGDAAAELAARFTDTPGPAGPLAVSSLSFDELQRGSGDVGTPTLVISTLPGVAGNSVTLTPLVGIPLFDVAYDPWPSPLAQQWQLAGTPVFAGVDMLVEQALIQVRIFVMGDPHTPIANEADVLARMRNAGVGG